MKEAFKRYADWRIKEHEKIGRFIWYYIVKYQEPIKAAFVLACWVGLIYFLEGGKL